MDKILEQISTYELLNNLLPGTFLCTLFIWHTGYQFEINNIFIELVVFYVAGLVAGRFGSLLVEPFYEKKRIIEKPQYSEFVEACKSDSKIETLSAVNNMYRTFTSVFFLFAIFLLGEMIITKFVVINLKFIIMIAVTVLLFILFTASFRKQTEYIKKRVLVQLKKGD